MYRPSILPGRRGAALLAAGLALSFAGCAGLRRDEVKVVNPVARFFPGGRPVQPEPGELQQSLLQFADAYCARIVDSVDELKGMDDPPFAPAEALRLKISGINNVLSIASGENPNINLINLLSMSTLSRMVLQKHWVAGPKGHRYEPWLDRAVALERKIWRVADRVLSHEQQEELRLEIERYYAAIKDVDTLFIAHPEDLAIYKHLRLYSNERSVFSLATINPFSGLDPTVREITQTRLFAERALFTIQWMPWLIRWQSDLLLLEATSQPGIAQTLSDVTRLSDSIQRASLAAESLGTTAAALPDRLSAERAAIVEAMNEQEEKITTMLQAGTETAVALNTTIESLDALMKRFGVGEPKKPRDPTRRRFDILDYAKTADAFTATAEQLNLTLTELNATLDSPALDRLSDQTTADARGVLNHAFKLAAGLVVLILACALLYRMLAKAKDRPR